METQELAGVQDFLQHAPLVAQRNPLTLNLFTKEWQFLADSEAKLTALMAGSELPDSAPGDAEYGLILSFLHQGLGAIPLKLLGMPDSQVSSATLAAWEGQLATGGVVMKDGTLISTEKFAVLDINWANSFVYYLHYRYSGLVPAILSGLKTHVFNQTPKTLALYGVSLKIAVIGDWGTGSWVDGASALCPAELISEGLKSLTRDLVIHLGDVYYYGSASQEQSGLLASWIGGPKGSFTLNSNHEMYDGANGYFSTALAAPAFSLQQQTSYFAITYGNWLIFGLDSAYYDQTSLYSKGTVSDTAQRDFIKTTLANPANAGKQVILMTHHNPIAYDGQSLSTYPGGSLAGDIYAAMGNTLPDYWYYGHLHNGIVYNAANLQNATANICGAFGKVPNFRCFGHAAIPFGSAKGLAGNSLVDYYTQTPIPSPSPNQTNRVLNGFALITLQADDITEEVYEVANKTGGGIDMQARWSNKP